MGVWQLIQDEILGMKWLGEVIGSGLSALGLDIEGRVGGSVQFFLYDVIKITVLLCLLIFGAEHFMIPAMVAILAGLTLIRKPMEKEAAV